MYVFYPSQVVFPRLLSLSAFFILFLGLTAHAQFNRLLTWEGNEDLTIACLEKSPDGYIGVLGCPINTPCQASNANVLDVFSLHEDLSLQWRKQILLDEKARSIHGLVVEPDGSFWLLTDYGIGNALFWFSKNGDLLDQVQIDEIGPVRFFSLARHPEGGVVVGGDLFQIGHYKDQSWEWEKTFSPVEIAALRQIVWTGTSFVALVGGGIPGLVQFDQNGEIQTIMDFTWDQDGPSVIPQKLVVQPDGAFNVIASYGNTGLAIIALSSSLEITDFQKYEGAEITGIQDAEVLPDGQLVVLASGGSDYQYQVVDGVLFVFDEALNFSSGYRVGEATPLTGQNILSAIAQGNTQQDFVIAGKLYTHELGLWQFKEFDPTTHPVCQGTNLNLVPIVDGYGVDLEQYSDQSVLTNLLLGEADVIFVESIDTPWSEICTEGVTSIFEQTIANAAFSLRGNGVSRTLWLEALADPNHSYEWTLHSSLGQLVRMSGNQYGSSRLQFENLPAGVYFLRVRQGTRIWVEKIQLN
jgi:hypothetical protein